MKRSGFKRQQIERKPSLVVPIPRDVAERISYATARLSVPCTKENPIQHQGYMAAVRTLPCAGCGLEGRSVFCHADEGKGMGIKSDCRLGWPGCGPHYEGAALVPGCHYEVGTTGKLGKQGRREFEANAGKNTRAEVKRRMLWPDTLPPWPGDEV